jgi:hypothetical protein
MAGTCFNSRKASNRLFSKELAFDFLDELADLRRRCLGLLVLNPDQGGLVLAIIEENLENPVG